MGENNIAKSCRHNYEGEPVPVWDQRGREYEFCSSGCRDYNAFLNPSLRFTSVPPDRDSRESLVYLDRRLDRKRRV